MLVFIHGIGLWQGIGWEYGIRLRWGIGWHQFHQLRAPTGRRCMALISMVAHFLIPINLPACDLYDDCSSSGDWRDFLSNSNAISLPSTQSSASISMLAWCLSIPVGLPIVLSTTDQWLLIMYGPDIAKSMIIGDCTTVKNLPHILPLAGSAILLWAKN